VDYLRAIRVRARGVAEMQRVFEQFDLLVAPAYAVTAPLAEGSFEAHYDEYPAPRLGAMGNLLGLPSVSVPTGLGENGMPTSLELLGKWWDEALGVQCAELYQGKTAFHTARPPQWDVSDR